MNALVDRFGSLCHGDPHRPLIHLPATRAEWTASQLLARSETYRAALAASNVRAGDLVLSATGNRPGTIALLLACWHTGAAVLPVDAGTPLSQILELAKRFHAAAVALPARSAHDGAADARPLDDEIALMARADTQPAECQGAALLKVTSGTSGLPKAVLCMHAQLLADTEHIMSAMGITSSDIQIAAIPFSHAYGFGNLVLPLILCGTAMVLRESFVPQLLPDDARRYGARLFHGIPFMFNHYLANPPAGGWPECLTTLVSAGARLELATIRGFHERFGVKIHSFYGTTESGGIAFDSSDEVDDFENVGWPLPGISIELRPDDGVPAPHGRIHVRGRSVSLGYVGGADDSSELAGGGFLTGDYGFLAPDGRLVLAGRVSSFINVAGRKVQPAEIEHVLLEMPQVTAARVIAATDASRGEQIAAVVAGSGPELTPATIRMHCAKRLPSYKIPRVVVIVDQLPLTARGKTDHRALSALVRALIDGSARSTV